MLNQCSALNFQQFDRYIGHIWRFFGCGFLATGRDVKKFLAVARHGQPKNSPNMVNISIKLLEIQCSNYKCDNLQSIQHRGENSVFDRSRRVEQKEQIDF